MLQKDFPQLDFFAPSQRNRSELVYVSELAVDSLLEDMPFSSDTESQSSSQESSGAEHMATQADVRADKYAADKRSSLYNSGLIVNQALKEKQGITCPWPPTCSDLTLESAASVTNDNQ